jgi:hypothetical protein
MTESVVLPPDRRALTMCSECSELDEKISHYREFQKQRFDPLTEERIKSLIAELEQRKASIH